MILGRYLLGYFDPSGQRSRIRFRSRCLVSLGRTIPVRCEGGLPKVAAVGRRAASKMVLDFQGVR